MAASGRAASKTPRAAKAERCLLDGRTSRRNAELEVGSSAHFEDPDYYTAAYRKRTADVYYYVEQAIEAGRSVLEYGCGNGRIAIPLARAGLDVWGIDRNAAMLGDLRERLLLEAPSVRARVRLRRGDMRSVRLRKRFGLVLCTFNTFLHLYSREDVERFLAGVRAHLEPDPEARFLVDVSVPDPVELVRRPERPYYAPRFRHPTTGQVVRYAERFDYDPLEQVLYVNMEFEPRDRPGDAWCTPLAHRQSFPQELEALLHYNGLRVVDVRADFTPEPPDASTSVLVLHCARRTDWRG